MYPKNVLRVKKFVYKTEKVFHIQFRGCFDVLRRVVGEGGGVY